MLLILLLLMLADDYKKQPSPKKELPTELCIIKDKQDLSKCLGQRVKLSGTVAKEILRPDADYPDISGIGGYTHLLHIDTEVGQIALLSRKKIDCTCGIEVEGILRLPPLSDEPLYYIQVIEFSCKEK